MYGYCHSMPSLPITSVMIVDFFKTSNHGILREKKKFKNQSSSEKVGKRGSYKCSQTFGKAVQKVQVALPKSPSKRKAVVKEIVNRTFNSEAWDSIYKEARAPRRDESAG
ncbi:unnamed protein product [Brassicogethes aeneus]|uniref:Uncharacterized protein n=1 Tax=Brassicogethes aeneus TaxID=1431903 RepID=A0A9P0FBM7_BRAAE|nr:unnamed protein product [Brassicogethes aeneus]